MTKTAEDVLLDLQEHPNSTLDEIASRLNLTELEVNTAMEELENEALACLFL